MDLLGEKNQDMTLEQVLKFVEAKYAGKRSASRLLLPQATDTVTRSSYRKQKKAQPKDVPPRDQDTCIYCVTKGHGRNAPTKVRRKECPAFGTKCNHCNKDHHFEVCRNKNGARPAAKDAEHEDMISDTCEDTTPDVLCGDTASDVLCEITSTDCTEHTTLTHHVFNKVTKEWLRKRSKPQPFIRLRMDIQQEDYRHFGFSLRTPQTHTFTSAMVDTGCQSCLVGLKVVKKLGLSTRDLIPADIKMHAANNNNIRILGATILRLSGKNKNGEEESTRQIVYVTDNTDKLFLSREACVDLGLITGTFPTIGETEATQFANSVNAVDTPQSPPVCQCPKCTKPSSIPNSLPFPATEANRGKAPTIPPSPLCLQHIQHM